MVTRSKSGIFKPTIFIVTKPMREIHVVPLFVSEALTNSIWKQAIMDEYQVLMRNNTWELVPAAENQHIVSNKWVYGVKYKAYGSLDKYKARLVDKGFQINDLLKGHF